jgi:hypothetical protein
MTFRRIRSIFPTLILASLAFQACAPALPAGVELDAGPALDVILAGSNVAHPRVFGVASDCADMHDGQMGYGFAIDGRCAGGLTVSEGVYIVLHPHGPRYSMNLAHEVVGHWAEGGDFDPGHSSSRFAPGGAVDAAKARLAGSPFDLIALPTPR